MKNKIYHNVRTVLKSNCKIEEAEEHLMHIDIFLHDCSFLGIALGALINSGRIKLCVCASNLLYESNKSAVQVFSTFV